MCMCDRQYGYLNWRITHILLHLKFHKQKNEMSHCEINLPYDRFIYAVCYVRNNVHN